MFRGFLLCPVVHCCLDLPILTFPRYLACLACLLENIKIEGAELMRSITFVCPNRHISALSQRVPLLRFITVLSKERNILGSPLHGSSEHHAQWTAFPACITEYSLLRTGLKLQKSCPMLEGLLVQTFVTMKVDCDTPGIWDLMNVWSTACKF